MNKETLAIFSLGLAVVMGGLVLIGYGLHMFNTLQFIVGFITAMVIGGACINTIFFDQKTYRHHTPYFYVDRNGQRHF